MSMRSASIRSAAASSEMPEMLSHWSNSGFIRSDSPSSAARVM